MIVSSYSILASVIVYNVCLSAAALFLRRRDMLSRNVVSVLLLLIFLSVLRLVVPVSMKSAHVIGSDSILPALRSWLGRPVIGDMTAETLLLAVWAAGAAAVIVRYAVCDLRFRREAARYQLTERRDIRALADELGIDCDVRVSPDITTPFTANAFRPVVYLPDAELSLYEWEAILRHEAAHISAYDNLIKLLLLLSEAVFWWNPMIHAAGEEISDLLELRCDERATAHMTPLERVDYCETLLKVLSLYQRGRSPAVASAAVKAEKRLRRRIRLVVEGGGSKKDSIFRRVGSVLLVALFIASYFVIIQPRGFPTEEDILGDAPAGAVVEDYGALDDGDVYLAVEDGEYVLYVTGTRVYPVPEELLQPNIISLFDIKEGGN